MKRSMLILGLAIFCGTVVAANVSKLSFSPEDPEALVLVEERDGGTRTRKERGRA